MANQEYGIDRRALPIYNARDLRWIFAVDEYVMHVKVVVPKHTGRELLFFGEKMRTDFEEIV